MYRAEKCGGYLYNGLVCRLLYSYTVQCSTRENRRCVYHVWDGWNSDEKIHSHVYARKDETKGKVNDKKNR